MVFSFSIVLYAQSPIDSLNNVLNNTTEDTVKIRTFLELFYQTEQGNPSKAENYLKSAILYSQQKKLDAYEIEALTILANFLLDQSKIDSAIVVYNQILDLAIEKDEKIYTSEALIGLGNCYLNLANYEKAKEFQFKNVQWCKEIGDELGLASSYNNIGNIYLEIGDFQNSMYYYTLSSNKYKKLKDNKNYGVLLLNIGVVLSKMEDYDKSFNYYQQATKIFEEINFETGLAFIYNSLSQLYKNKEQLDSAIYFNEEALRFFEKLNNQIKISEVLYSKASIFWEKQDYQNALYFYNKSLEKCKEMDYKTGEAYALKAIGDTYLKMDKLENSVTYLEKSLLLSKSIRLAIIEMDSYQSLSEAYAAKKDYSNAYQFLNKFIAIKDSLEIIEKINNANEIEEKFQSEKKNAKIALLESENKIRELKLNQSNNQRNATILIAILLVLLIGLFIRLYYIKQQSNKKLKELDRLKSNFFANISHEFRTPLTLLKGPIQQMEQNPDRPLGSKLVKMMKTHANRLLDLVNQLLDLSKIEEGKMQLVSTEGDIFKCLRTLSTVFNSLAASRLIDYKVNIPNYPLWCSFDRDKVEKIIYNILSNSFKFTEDGGLIAFSVSFSSNCLKIEIKDNGIGIEEDKIPYVFNRFYQVDNNQTKGSGGTGIGLALSKSLIDLMHGTIIINSELNKGTSVEIQLPIQEIKTRTNSFEKTINLNAEVTIDNSYNFKKEDERNLPLILLVEDNKDMRFYIKSQLINEYKIIEAKNGKEGVEMAISFSPVLIISDLMMPKMDGIEMCYLLKNNIDTSHIPIIMLTARANVESKIESLENGADDYLTKPFDKNELQIRVKNLIVQREKLRQLFANTVSAVLPKEVAVNSIDQNFIKSLLEILETHYANPDFGVPQLQDEMGMSKNQLHRKTKALTNEAPGELIRNFRLKRAAQLIVQKADTISQIGYAVGFNNPSYFTKCFKKLFGVSPSAYPNK